MSRRGGKKPPSFTWCTTCEEKAFIKGTRGSMLDLDCGHSVSAMAHLANMRREDEHSAGPPRLVRKDKAPTWGARQQEGGKHERERSKPTGERVQEDARKRDPRPPSTERVEAPRGTPPRGVTPAASSFDPKRVANMVDDLIKGKKR